MSDYLRRSIHRDVSLGSLKSVFKKRTCKLWRKIKCGDSYKEKQLFFKTVGYSGDGVVISSKDSGVVRTMKSPDIGIG